MKYHTQNVTAQSPEHLIKSWIQLKAWPCFECGLGLETFQPSFVWVLHVPLHLNQSVIFLIPQGIKGM